MSAHPIPFRRALVAVLSLTVALLAGARASSAADEIPLMQDLVKPAAAEGQSDPEEQKVQVPVRLDVQEADFEAQHLLPAGPLLYLDTSNLQALQDAFRQTSLNALLEDSRIENFLKDNPLTLANLFTDLPAGYADPHGIALLNGARTMARAFFDTPGRAAFGYYRTEAGGHAAVLLIEIGRDREAPFHRLIAARDEFLNEQTEILLQETPHTDDFIDIMRPDPVSGSSIQLAYGVVRNFVVLCTNGEFARGILAGAKGDAASNEASLSRSNTYLELGAYADAQAHIRGFTDLRGILTETRENALSTPTETLDFVADLVGRGGGSQSPQVLYYDLRAEGETFVEHIVSPTHVGPTDKPGLPARLATVCLSADALKTPVDWITPRLMPYQPHAVLAMHLNPRRLQDFLNLDQGHLGGSEYAKQLEEEIPQPLKTLLTQTLQPGIEQVLSGEVSLALLPPRGEETRPWMVVMALTSAATAETRLAGDPTVSDQNGVQIRARHSDGWQAQPCWAVFDQGSYKHLTSIYGQTPASCLVIASSGNLMQDIVDQVTALSSLADNKDFLRQIETAGRDASCIAYYNLPGLIGRRYVEVPQILHQYFPRLKNISNLPPSGLLLKQTAGVGISTDIRANQSWVRTTTVSSIPLAPTLSGKLLMNLPVWIRERERSFQDQSRTNLGKIWLELQAFVTQRGHFPESYTALRELFPRDDRRQIFTALAAVESLGDDASINSYRYVPGLRATDEADMPILYETGAWHWEYADMLPTGNVAPVESGPYQPYRLVLQIDGTIRAYTDDEFKKKVLPRIREHE